MCDGCLQAVRLENQVKRFKVTAENLEKSEEELKAEKRKFQKDVCLTHADLVGGPKQTGPVQFLCIFTNHIY